MIGLLASDWSSAASLIRTLINTATYMFCKNPLLFILLLVNKTFKHSDTQWKNKSSKTKKIIKKSWSRISKRINKHTKKPREGYLSKLSKSNDSLWLTVGEPWSLASVRFGNSCSFRYGFWRTIICTCICWSSPGCTKRCASEEAAACCPTRNQNLETSRTRQNNSYYTVN